MQNLINDALRKLCKRGLVILLVYSFPQAASLAYADILRMADGQVYSQNQFKELTLDGGYRIAEDSQRYGLRLALPILKSGLVPFAELTRAEVTLTDIAAGSDVDFTYHRASGGGFFYTDIPDWQNRSLVLRVSHNEETIDSESNIAVSGFQASARVKSRAFSVSLLVSPKTALMSNGSNGYLAVGLTLNKSRTTVLVDDRPEPALSRDEDNIDPYLAAGMVYPFGRFSLYGVLSYEQEVSLAIGVRLQVSRVAPDQ